MKEYLQGLLLWLAILVAAVVILVPIVFIVALLRYRYLTGNWSDAFKEAKSWARSMFDLILHPGEWT